jgi:hypothetical protein
MAGSTLQHCNGCKDWQPKDGDRSESEEGICICESSEKHNTTQMWFDTCAKWEKVVVAESSAAAQKV